MAGTTVRLGTFAEISRWWSGNRAPHLACRGKSVQFPSCGSSDCLAAGTGSRDCREFQEYPACPADAPPITCGRITLKPSPVDVRRVDAVAFEPAKPLIRSPSRNCWSANPAVPSTMRAMRPDGSRGPRQPAEQRGHFHWGRGGHLAGRSAERSGGTGFGKRQWNQNRPGVDWRGTGKPGPTARLSLHGAPTGIDSAGTVFLVDAVPGIPGRRAGCSPLKGGFTPIPVPSPLQFAFKGVEVIGVGPGP